MSTNSVPMCGIAGGTIQPSVFVMQSTVQDKEFLQATANAQIFAVSQTQSHDAPGLTGSSTAAATAGQLMQLFINGDICSLTVGAGGSVNEGDLLYSDANGGAVTGTPANNIGARANEAGTPGSIIQATVFIQNATTSAASFVTSGTSATAVAVLAAQNGVTFRANNSAATITYTLPAVATISAGWRTRYETLAVPGAGAGTTIAINAADTAAVYIYGNGYTTPVAGHGSKNTQATSKTGDIQEITYDGANFLITSTVGTWTNT